MAPALLQRSVQTSRPLSVLLQCSNLTASVCTRSAPVHKTAGIYSPLIIMHMYDALINARCAHMIHINLNMIFCTHVEHTPTQSQHTDYTNLNLHSLKRVANRDFRRMKTAARNGKRGTERKTWKVYSFGGECFEITLKWVYIHICNLQFQVLYCQNGTSLFSEWPKFLKAIR